MQLRKRFINLKAWLAAAALSACLLLLTLAFSQTLTALTAGLNQHSGKAYPINDGSTQFNNVAPGEGDAYEGDFFRVGNTWTRDGSGMGSTLEVCDENQPFDLWVYAHNGANFRDNHTGALSDKTIAQLEAETVDNDFNFAADGVLKNVRVQIRHSGQSQLDSSIFANSHTLEAILIAEHRSGGSVAKAETLTITCSTDKIALTAQGSETPSVFTWGAETSYANYKARHDKAEAVFGAGYSLSSPGDIFAANGTAFGFDGWVPASRYYAAHIKAQLKPVKETTPPPCVGKECQQGDTSIPDTGIGASNLSHILTLSIGAAGLAFYGHRAISRRSDG